MPLSGDPERRRRQLANLRRGGANVGSFQPGQPSPALKHGARTRPTGSREWESRVLGPVADLILDALADGAPVRDLDGQVPVHDRIAVESAALQVVIVRRLLGYLATNGDTDARGRWRPEWAELRKHRESLDRALGALGMTPAGRMRLNLDVARTFDLAAHWAAEDDAERAAPIDATAHDVATPEGPSGPAEPMMRPGATDGRGRPAADGSGDAHAAGHGAGEGGGDA